MTKTERLKRALYFAGEEGIHSFDLLNIAGYRYAARVHDLRSKGLDIASVPEKKGDAIGCRYFLIKKE